ncbi:hypothetical protein LshimejAT787_0505930 [Lyophyllum shimeji]|uniref:Uncharacterized protein n=1 Tax=Lyophyllum shimeji TaxID=47721 RepID=A0A9P3PMP7_LYOSH|nr:hypothetical protein LshimejAT787_0505930 [Lyophyllum shimeji]
MSNVTCYGFKCATVSNWEPSLRSCCEPNHGRSVSEFGQYYCAGNSLGQMVSCFNQTYQAKKSQFDVYTLTCFDSVGGMVDAGVVSTSNSSAFGCSRNFLSNCYDANGNHTEDPRNGTCDAGSNSPSGAAAAARHHSWAAVAVVALVVSSFVTMA